MKTRICYYVVTYYDTQCKNIIKELCDRVRYLQKDNWWYGRWISDIPSQFEGGVGDGAASVGVKLQKLELHQSQWLPAELSDLEAQCKPRDYRRPTQIISTSQEPNAQGEYLLTSDHGIHGRSGGRESEDRWDTKQEPRITVKMTSSFTTMFPQK